MRFFFCFTKCCCLFRFHNQSSGLRFGTFVFGPVIMRFLHSVNQPNEVLALLKNPKTVSLFDQFMSYQIAMDLLLKNKMYNEVIEVYNIVQDRTIQGNKYPKNCLILAMAALFRMVSYFNVISILKFLGFSWIHFLPILEHTRKLSTNETHYVASRWCRAHTHEKDDHLCRSFGIE